MIYFFWCERKMHKVHQMMIFFSLKNCNGIKLHLLSLQFILFFFLCDARKMRLLLRECNFAFITDLLIFLPELKFLYNFSFLSIIAVTEKQIDFHVLPKLDINSSYEHTHTCLFATKYFLMHTSDGNFEGK
jgi:hypothetical protein